MAEEKALVTYKSRDGQEIKLSFDAVRKYLISGKPELVTDAEIVMYMGTCKARGLNPFKKDCYLVKYTPNDNAALIVSIDYFRSRARAMPDCAGWQSGVIVKDADGKIQQRPGSFMVDGDELLGGWFKAKPKGWEVDFEWSVNLAPFIKYKQNGDVTKFWSKENQPQQIVKVAESQGLRRMWPDEFQAMYTEDEMLDMRDVSPDPAPVKEPLPLPPQKITEPMAKKIYTAAQKHGVEDKALETAIWQINPNWISIRDVTRDKYDELMAWIETASAEQPAPTEDDLLFETQK